MKESKVSWLKRNVEWLKKWMMSTSIVDFILSFKIRKQLKRNPSGTDCNE